jgi:hypothetical protein
VIGGGSAAIPGAALGELVDEAEADAGAEAGGETAGGEDATVEGVGDGVLHAASSPARATTMSGRRIGFIGCIVGRSARVARQP